MDFNSLLEQLQTQRPELADSLALLRQYQNKKEKEDEDTTVDLDREEKLTALLEKQKEINKGILHQFRKLERNYQLLIEQMDQFAEAVGACPECWGEDPLCNSCHGRGKPGYYQPNPTYFNMYIRPVLSKLKTINNNS